MKTLIAAVSIATLSGCVSESTQMKNSQGQTLRCAHWGFGIIGAPVAMAAQAECVKKAKDAGYSDGPVP